MPKKLPKNFTVTPSANAGEPAELAIRGVIGDSWDMDEYTMSNTEEEVINALADIPKGTKINLRINSPGGNVAYALGIYNALKRRAGDVTTYNEGIACSSASVLMCAGARAVMPKSSVFMIHCASNGAYGNAVELAKNIELLNTFDKTIAAVLAEKSKKTPEAIMDLMKAESWMTGDEARQNGFADESNDDEPLMNSATADSLARFKHTPQNLRSRLVTAAAVPNPQTTPEISMKKIIAALVAAGITALAADASEDAIANAVTGLADERNRFKTANDAQVTAQKTRVTNRVQAAIDAKKVKAERKDALIAIGVANEAGLDFLDDITVAAPANAAQPRQRGANPAPAADAGEAGEVESEIATLRESNRTEKDPTLLANNSRRLRELRGHKELFTPAKN